MSLKKHSGFNLIEIIITASIIGILSMLSVPLYTQYIVSTQRQEAEHMLSKLAIAMENYFEMHRSYADASLHALGFTDKIAGGKYALKISAMSDSNFQLLAEPLALQAERDGRCSTLGLDAFGVKTITGYGKSNECW